MAKVVREPIGRWWKIASFGAKLEPLRVVAFSGSFVTYLQKSWRMSGPDVFHECRESRNDIFPTFAEAKEEAVKRCTARVEQAEEELQLRRTQLGTYEAMTEPK